MIVDTDNGYIPRPPIPVPTPTPDLSIIPRHAITTWYFIRNNREIFVVIDEYDTTDLSTYEFMALVVLRSVYLRINPEESFEIYVWRAKNIEIFAIIFDDNDDDDDGNGIPEPTEYEKWSIWLKERLKFLGLSTGATIAIVGVLGVIGLGLVGYQYTQSYISEKGAEKARGN